MHERRFYENNVTVKLPSVCVFFKFRHCLVFGFQVSSLPRVCFVFRAAVVIAVTCFSDGYCDLLLLVVRTRASRL